MCVRSESHTALSRSPVRRHEAKWHRNPVRREWLVTEEREHGLENDRGRDENLIDMTGAINNEMFSAGESAQHFLGIRKRRGRLATAAVGSPAPSWRRGSTPARVAAPPHHEEDPCHSGAPDGERDRRSGSCAADGCGQRAGRLGACAGLFGGSGHRDYLRAGAAANGPQNGRIRLRLEPETLTRRAYAGALRHLNG